jgi:hypothetical protein
MKFKLIRNSHWPLRCFLGSVVVMATACHPVPVISVFLPSYTWCLTNVNFNDGGQVVFGCFDFDDVSTFSNISVRTNDGVVPPPTPFMERKGAEYHFVESTFPSSSSSTLFVTKIGDNTGLPGLNLLSSNL